MTDTAVHAPPEFEAIAPVWDRLAVHSPHACRSLYSLVQRTSGGMERPHVTILDRGGSDSILVVGRVEHRPVVVRAGYRKLLTLGARWLTIVPGGVVGVRDEADGEVVMSVLMGALEAEHADILELSKVVVGSPLACAAMKRLPWYRVNHGGFAQPHRCADLSGGFEAYLARRSRNTRQRLRRRLRKLESSSERICVRRIGPGDDVEANCRELERIASASYQRGLDAGFRDDQLHRELMSWSVDGRFRVWILSIDGTPCAFLSGLVHDATFFLFDMAFDPAYAAEEPGALLQVRVLEELADDPGVDAYDFAFGDAQYKQSLSDECWQEIDILGFAARPRALAAQRSGVRIRVGGLDRQAGAGRRTDRTSAAPGAGRTRQFGPGRTRVGIIVDVPVAPALHVSGVLLPEDTERDLYIVGDRLTFEPVAGAEPIADGGFVLPGLVDAHCHIGISATSSAVADVAEAKAMALINREARRPHHP